MKEEFNAGNKLVAGRISTDQPPLAAGTYHRGMILEFDETESNYKALSDAGKIGVIYNGVDGQKLAAAGFGDCIVTGEIGEAGLVNSDGTPMTITEKIRAEARAAGFYLKRA